ncbi:hypothetical protein D3C85_1536970 [compost metagenome]
MKLQNKFISRPIKRIYRLVIVTDNHQILMNCRNHFNNFILNRIRILEFIDTDVCEFPLHGAQNFSIVEEQLVRFDQNIIEIDLLLLHFPLFIL